MLADIGKPIISGRLKGPDPDAPILTAVNCLEEVLINFSDKDINSEIKNEKGLTQKLIYRLSLYAHRHYYPFYFDKEYMENPERGDSPQVDIAIISTHEENITIGAKIHNGESFFSMEAKRLANLGVNRQKEYLIGRYEKEKYISCGGVERFKQGIHGSKLNYGAIIGYVQEHDFEYWHDQLNRWVDELIIKKIFSPVTWTRNDKLEKEYISFNTAKFISENSRENGAIILFHFWVKLI